MGGVQEFIVQLRLIRSEIKDYIPLVHSYSHYVKISLVTWVKVGRLGMLTQEGIGKVVGGELDVRGAFDNWIILHVEEYGRAK